MLIVKSQKAVVFYLREPGRILNVIPTAKSLLFKGKQLVVVPHRVEETQVLRNIGFDVPSPMSYQYEWPGMYKPFHAQKVTAEFMSLIKRGFCLNDIGTGKTLATLWTYDFLRSKGQKKRALVVTPLSTLERTWADEIFTHFPHLNAQVLYGTRDKRIKLLNTEADLYLVNHDGLAIIKDSLKFRADIDLVIVDEVAQVARNSNTDRWRALNEVINKQTPRDAWGLTGTPTPNGPTDAWAQCRLLVPEKVTPYFGRFRDTVMRQINQFTWAPRDNALDVVHGIMQPAIRFNRDDCVDLPPCLYDTRQVELTAKQRKAYKEMLNKLKTEADSGEILAVNEAVKAQKLIQICCGVAYDADGSEVIIDATPRMEAVMEVVEQAGTKVIVFAPFVSVVNHLAKYLTDRKITAEVIHGGVSKNERDRIFTAFQKGSELRVLVAQPAAMSHGLTLTAASTIVWYAPVTSNDTFTQANGRITRPSQKNNQFIVMIEGTEIERKYYERLRTKQKMQGALLQMIRESDKT